jgi:NDP-sugar pyrophosphorylase family protein
VGIFSTEHRYHITYDHDLLAINHSFLEEGRDASILSDLPGSVMIIPPVRIDPSVSVGQNARIGPYVYLESGSVVGAGAMIENSVVLRNATVAKDEVCRYQIVTRTTRISVPN